MDLTQKQVRILQALAIKGDWMTRKSMEITAGLKGYSEALGSPTSGLRSNSLEAQGLVQRRSDTQPYEYKITATGLSALREIGFEVPRRQAAGPVLDAQVVKDEFEAAVRRSQRDSSTERRRRLATASKFPEVIEVRSVAYRRNADVVAEVLDRANGLCEACGQRAPFERRSDGTPYLEVHHKRMLADGGEDTLVNAMAICPNCHRKSHYA